MRFRLLTYNIHKAIGVDRRFRPERIIAILKRHNADVVLLQEVDRGVPRSGHIDLASYIATAVLYQFRAVGMNVHLKKGKYGNATLSRFPIGRQRNIDLSIGRRKRRGAQHTRIILPKRGDPTPIDIFNIHLGLSALERRRQVRRLLESPDIAQLDPSAPCVIAGDLNDWRGVLRRQRFTDAGFLCATNRRPGSRWSIKTFPSYAPTGGLDKIFYCGSLRLLHVRRSRLALARVASDHLPVIADFEV
ncbi:MAG: endonuclease/exonuclease/phosphatase family protein [Planctomycetes bacterium]|nr:endonuclease/exonuclease/phosphatase family protein [Planctomycetota bacterium]